MSQDKKVEQHIADEIFKPDVIEISESHINENKNVIITKPLNDKQDAPQVQFRMEFDELSEKKDKRLKDILRNDEYQFNYPVFNFDQKGYRRIPYVDPRFATFEQQVEESFSLNVAKMRDIASSHEKPLILSSLATAGLLWKKPKDKITAAMLFITSTLGVSYLYFSNMGFGNMINRVNIEAFRILNQEKKAYLLSDQEVQTSQQLIKSQIDKEMEEFKEKYKQE
ncbi:predicted protein [Naegleria gruberi]|uniref:Predicted protein n=1 Tax=Naegleria gruberi TaxID=5762 RepID=D2VD10_NAEGR|nr:uncharacterized protein NAEGRDRAFT_48550 [Naegleria gruberi]EFC45401.1 predicted protein [Naegleria gruberi]|eukprot:XP_002678145.1 predicted protein [Naegleria gruberi strain NEG-M]